MASAKKKIEGQLTCSICLELFKDTITLPCMYSSRRNCLKNVSEANQGELACPLCKRDAGLQPNETIDSLPKNCQLSNVVSAFEEFRAVHPDAAVRVSAIPLREAPAPSSAPLLIPSLQPSIANPRSIINVQSQLNVGGGANIHGSSVVSRVANVSTNQNSASNRATPQSLAAVNTSPNQSSAYSRASAPPQAAVNTSTNQNSAYNRAWVPPQSNQQSSSLGSLPTEEDDYYSRVELYQQFLSMMRGGGQGGVSHHVTCSSCGREVFGVRYRCRECVNFDLCSDCESAGHHAKHDMLKVVNPKPSFPRIVFRTANTFLTGTTIKCNICSRNISGVRYRCCECEDFDLCKSCERKHAHPNHDMRKVVNPKLFRNNVPTFEEARRMKLSGKLHTRVTCDVCRCKVQGIRFKCAVCDNFDLCGMCLVTGNHLEHDMRRIDAQD